MNRLIDTHCHIHEADYPYKLQDVIDRSVAAGVTKIICIGTDEAGSMAALKAAEEHDEIFATVGIHPYYADYSTDWMEDVLKSKPAKLVAIGEIGLDYFRNPQPREAQIKLLEKQIDLALKYNLPISFHVRGGYKDFWPVLGNFSGGKLRGVVHCFSGGKKDVEKALARNLHFAINGISTFTRDVGQKEILQNLPIDKIILETDAPYLTPAALQDETTINEPAFIREIAEYNAKQRGISLEDFAKITTKTAEDLFQLDVL